MAKSLFLSLCAIIIWISTSMFFLYYWNGMVWQVVSMMHGSAKWVCATVDGHCIWEIHYDISTWKISIYYDELYSWANVFVELMYDDELSNIYMEKSETNCIINDVLASSWDVLLNFIVPDKSWLLIEIPSSLIQLEEGMHSNKLAFIKRAYVVEWDNNFKLLIKSL